MKEALTEGIDQKLIDGILNEVLDRSTGAKWDDIGKQTSF